MPRLDLILNSYDKKLNFYLAFLSTHAVIHRINMAMCCLLTLHFFVEKKPEQQRFYIP